MSATATTTEPMLPAITPSGEAWEPKTLEKLADYPEAKFNLLVPTVQLRQVNPYLVPDIEVVQLSEDDIYHDSQMAEGQYAPNARGLAKLANVAGITQLDSRRMDAGRDPDVVEWRVEVEMTTPSGRPVRGFGTKSINLHQFAETTNREGKTPSKQRMDKSREHLVANAETKAFNRAVRGLLSLHGSYPKARLLRPFAVLRYVPDMSQPEVRQAFLGQLVPAAERLYGPANGDATKQLPTTEVAAEAPEEDPAPARDDVDADGVLKDEDPDWSKPAEAAAAAAAEATTAPSDGEQFVIALRERAEASAHSQKEAPSPERWQVLSKTLSGLKVGELVAVLRPAFGINDHRDITAAQAEAILDHAEGRKDFIKAWRAAGAEMAAA